MVLYDSEGEYLHGLHEADSGLDRPWGISNYEGTLLNKKHISYNITQMAKLLLLIGMATKPT